MDKYFTKLALIPTEAVPSLYAQYVTERTEDAIIESAEGFATYRFINGGKSVYIVDIFVLPQFRKTGLAAALADKIAAIGKEKGCKELLGSVCPSANNSTTSLRVLLGYGMALQSASDNFVVFRKDL